MVVPKANRTRGVLLILVPVLLTNAVWLTIALIFKPITSDQATFDALVLSLAVGSAVLWLLGHVLASCTQRKAMVLALSVALGVAFVGALSVTDSSRQTIVLPSLLGFVMSAMVLGHAGAARMSRRTYRPTRFILLLAAWTVAFSAAGMSLWFLLESALTAHWPIHVLPVLGVCLLAGSVTGVCVFLVSLAFVLVGWRSPLFRPRLFACLRLQAAPRPAGFMTPTQP